MMLEILLSTGHILNLDDIDPDLITLEEIANSLSKQCRFGGKCQHFYSVAQHSVICSHFVAKGFELEALLHDAAEGILQDIISPYKRLCGEITKYEDEICNIIGDKLGLEPDFHKLPEVKTVDHQCFVTETKHLICHMSDYAIALCGKYYEDGDLSDSPQGVKNSTAKITEFLYPASAYDKFVDRFIELTGHDSFDKPFIW